MKKYFKDLDTKTKIEIIMNNEDLKNELENKYYQRNMEMQEEEGKYMFGNESWKYIDIRDNYDSFYLVLKNWHNFLDNLDSDYLCQDGIDLYNEIMLLKNEYENIDVVEEEEKFDNLEEKLESKCKELLKICEEQLHEYEKYNNEDFKDYLEFELEENNILEDYYILDNNYKKVYLDINYTKEFE